MDEIQAAVKTCFNKFANFNGRAARPEFWWFALFSLVVTQVTSIIFAPLGMLVSLALLVPSLSVGARRLHDIDKSGWLQLLWLIPFIGWAIMIWWLVQPGQPAANQYGEPPTATVATNLAPGQQ